MIRLKLLWLAAFLILPHSAVAKPKPPLSVRPEPVLATDECGKATYAALPRYPINEIRRAQPGWVVVEFTISGEGEVISAKVSDSSPEKLFDESAIEATLKSAFSPQGREIAGCKRLVAFSIGRWD